jgi:CRISPR-associated protein Cas5d
MMTPSAARGVLEAILYKPEMYWHIRRIALLEPWWLRPDSSRPPYRLVSVRRNEIQGKIAPRTVLGWKAKPESFEPYFADSAGRESIGKQSRTQRNTLALRDVVYLIHASPLLTDKANRQFAHRLEEVGERGPDTVAKYVAMFQRRVERGQCFHRPYLGCREFACYFGPASGDERPVNWSESLGLMLYDIRFQANGHNIPGFFEAKVQSGILHCDTLDSGPNGEPPVKIFGWAQEVAS